MHLLGANNILMPFKSNKFIIVILLLSNNINRNVGSSHLCFYTCMTTIGQSENVLESSKSFLKVLHNSGKF